MPSEGSVHLDRLGSISAGLCCDGCFKKRSMPRKTRRENLMRWSGLMIVAAVAVVGLVPAETASAQQGEVMETFTCESLNGKHHEFSCRSSGLVTVHVRKQMSRSRCVFNESWGTYDGGVWVDNGCRASFTYASRRILVHALRRHAVRLRDPLRVPARRLDPL
jgi:hypothetical protein